MPTKSQTLFLLNLPNEILTHILQFFTPEELTQLDLISKQFQRLTSTNSLWKWRIKSGISTENYRAEFFQHPENIIDEELPTHPWYTKLQRIAQQEDQSKAANELTQEACQSPIKIKMLFHCDKPIIQHPQAVDLLVNIIKASPPAGIFILSTPSLYNQLFLSNAKEEEWWQYAKNILYSYLPYNDIYTDPIKEMFHSSFIDHGNIHVIRLFLLTQLMMTYLPSKIENFYETLFQHKFTEWFPLPSNYEPITEEDPYKLTDLACESSSKARIILANPRLLQIILDSEDKGIKIGYFLLMHIAQAHPEAAILILQNNKLLTFIGNTRFPEFPPPYPSIKPGPNFIKSVCRAHKLNELFEWPIDTMHPSITLPILFKHLLYTYFKKQPDETLTLTEHLTENESHVSNNELRR